MKKNKIIVTGGYGFIGSHFVNYLLENTNDEVVIVDKVTYAANPTNLKGNVSAIEQDICDVTAEQIGDFDYMVHFAAESHVDNSIKDGRPFVRTNVEGTFNLLEIARKNKNLKKFVHISTDEVYGDVHGSYFSSTENSHIKPSSYYSATKAASDLLVMAASRTYGLPYVITRTCNNYGENQHSEKFLPTLIRSVKNDVEIPIYGDGQHIREWIHATDNARAIYNVMMSSHVNTTFNIGSKDRYRNIEIVNMVSSILQKVAKYKFVEDRLGHDKEYSIDCTRYKNFFGYPQSISFIYWLKKTIQNER